MTNAFGFPVDSGTFRETFDRALALADLPGFAARREASAARGWLRGLGFAYHLKGTGGSPQENVEIRFEADGTVSLITGTQTIGQGHETTFPQILADRLGVPNALIRLRQGDTDLIPMGGGHGSSRATYMGGTAIWRAAEVVVEKGSASRRRLWASPKPRFASRTASSPLPAPTARSGSWRRRRWRERPERRSTPITTGRGST